MPASRRLPVTDHVAVAPRTPAGASEAGGVPAAPAPGRAGAASPAATRLTGRGLVAARAAYLATVAALGGLFVAALPARAAQLARLFQTLTPAQEAALREAGISGAEHARLVFGLELLVAAAFAGSALLIFWRRADDWVAMYVSAALVGYVVWVAPPLDALAAAPSPLRGAASAAQAAGATGALLFFYLFPDGRFVPRWTRLLPVAAAAWATGWVLAPASPLALADPFRLPLPSFLALMACWATGIAAQLYRFARAASPVQRQQTRLVLVAVAVGTAGYLVFGFDRFAVPVVVGPQHAGVVYDLLGVPLFLLTAMVIPVAFVVSVLRYRLWDADVVIGRAFVYATLTALLAGLYAASIGLFQRAFAALTGAHSEAAIVLTTIVVASALTPLKGALERIADRYVRQSPDPTRHLRAFDDRVRALVEVLDPDQLTGAALDELVRGFGAASGAVYLRGDGGFRLTQARGEWTQVEGMAAPLAHGGDRYGWVALGPRRSGLGYAPADREALAATAALVARAISLRAGPRAGRGPLAPVPPAGAVGPGEGDRA